MKFPQSLRLVALSALLLFSFLPSGATAQTRWKITDDGGIVWKVKPGEAHEDNIEMSGKKVSVIVTYGVDTNGALTLRRFVIFPTFCTMPQKILGHISAVFGDDASPRILLNRAVPSSDKVQSIHHHGIMEIHGRMGGRRDAVDWTRKIFPSTDQPAVIETISFTNLADASVTVEVEDTSKIIRTAAARGLEGAYVMSSRVLDAGERMLKPGEDTTFVMVFSARKGSDPDLAIDANAEEQARASLVESYLDKLQLDTPDKILNTMFAFAKIRATESIILTKDGLMHAPGGGRFYGAIWANDQGEYGPPFFPFLGDATGEGAASNAFRLFATYMNPDYKPLPGSILAGVTNESRADRGDMAMLAYGASRYALASGDKTLATQEWPLIEWCLEYCKRKLDTAGVVESDTDELENRFPAGKANLCTSCLYYDALNSAVYLGKDLGAPESQMQNYDKEAVAVRAAIEKYFGCKVAGFETYRYFDKSLPSVNEQALQRFAHYENEPDHLREWICMPLTVGIFDRAQGTIAALFSPQLWTPDGLATEAGGKIFWDRSTLYALRGVFAAGDTEKALKHLQDYSTRRLLGEHVPYAVEASKGIGGGASYNQTHLAAESALYCRIYTEGMFGIRPAGLRTFNCTPRLPKEWASMALRHIHAFGNDFDLLVSRAGNKLQVRILENGVVVKTLEIADGDTATIGLGS